MKTTIVDLRYKMKEVLNALNHRERITIFYHGKVKGIIIPVIEKIKQRVNDHPIFGILKNSPKSVEQQMDELRGGRYRDL